MFDLVVWMACGALVAWMYRAIDKMVERDIEHFRTESRSWRRKAERYSGDPELVSVVELYWTFERDALESMNECIKQRRMLSWFKVIVVVGAVTFTFVVLLAAAWSA